MKIVFIETDRARAERDLLICGDRTLLIADAEAESEESTDARVRSLVCEGGRGKKLRAAIACAFGEMGADAVITLPASGECTAEDIEKVEKALEEGASAAVCDLHEPSPMLFGWAFKLLTRMTAGLKVAPWASLRGYKADCASLAASVKGEDADYEAALLQAIVTEKLPLSQLTAEEPTAKPEKRRKSIVTAFRAGIGILNESPSLKFLLSSCIAFVIDTLLFMLIAAALPWSEALDEAVAQPIAWLVSSLCNFTINRTFVFRSKGGTLKALMQYYPLAVFVLIGKMGLLYFFSTILSFWRLPSKLACEVTFFFFNYFVQKTMIFSRKKAKNRHAN